jgi:hypothetical protein
MTFRAVRGDTRYETSTMHPPKSGMPRFSVTFDGAASRIDTLRMALTTSGSDSGLTSSRTSLHRRQ